MPIVPWYQWGECKCRMGCQSFFREGVSAYFRIPGTTGECAPLSNWWGLRYNLIASVPCFYDSLFSDTFFFSQGLAQVDCRLSTEAAPGQTHRIYRFTFHVYAPAGGIPSQQVLGIFGPENVTDCRAIPHRTMPGPTGGSGQLWTGTDFGPEIEFKWGPLWTGF